VPKSDKQLSLSVFLSTLGMDISCDLIELGRTNVAVVCAGVKSILDIGLTLEFLVGCVKHFLIYLESRVLLEFSIFSGYYILSSFVKDATIYQL
jgi:Indigoidine synthase A like protein